MSESNHHTCNDLTLTDLQVTALILDVELWCVDPHVVVAVTEQRGHRASRLGGGGPGGGGQPGYKTLPKQASSRSIGSTDSSQSTASSRKSSNSSNTSDCSLASAAGAEISQSALEEIAAFEKFITEYFENSDNNNTAAAARKASHPPAGRARQKVSASSVLSEVLELSI